MRRPVVALLVTLLVAGLAVPAAAQTGPRPTPTFVDATLRRMSLEEKVGQLFWTRVWGTGAHDTSAAAQNQTDFGVDTPAQVVEKYHLGGVLYFGYTGNVVDPAQLARFSNELQEVAVGDRRGVPLDLSIDQEGGIVARLLAPWTEFPGNMAAGASGADDLVAQQWAVTGEELRAVGITTDFGPVVDVNTNPLNPVIGVRSFGEDPALVGRLGTIATAALQEQGVSATLKHFPGHGDTEVDSHFGLPSVSYDRQTLEEVHLAPFRAALESDPDLVMSAHIVLEAVDPDLPATLSHPVLTGILREDMGYEGVIVTDALDMQGAREEFGDDQIPVMALQAGADVLLNPPDMEVAYQGVLDAVRSGAVSEGRVDESVRRILALKAERDQFRQPFVDEAAVGQHVGTPEHLAVAAQLGERAATVVRNDAGVLPLAAGDGRSAVAVGPTAAQPGMVADGLAQRGYAGSAIATAATPTAAQIDQAAAAADAADLAVVTTSSAWRSAAQQELVRAVVATGTPTVVLATRDAYDVGYLPTATTAVATYGTRGVSIQGAVSVLFGEVTPTGRLPVAISSGVEGAPAYPIGHGLTYGD